MSSFLIALEMNFIFASINIGKFIYVINKKSVYKVTKIVNMNAKDFEKLV